MVGRYLDGSRPVHASDLLEDAAGRVLKQRESRLPVSAAGPAEREEGWGCDPYPCRRS